VATVDFKPHGQDALPVCLGLENSNGLVSLLAVYQFAAARYTKCCFTLHDLIGDAYGLESEDDPTDRSESLESVKSGLQELADNCTGMGLDCVDMVRRVSGRIADDPSTKSAVALIDELKHAVLREFKGRRCYLMTLEESKFMDWAPSKSILLAFPKSAGDLKQAAECLAFGRYKATVFHSMNALEFPLRAVARYFDVPFKNATTWGTAITNIKDKIDAISRRGKPGARKTDTLHFYGEAAKEFSYFAEAWRNHVMHGRGEHDAHTAHSVWEHVWHFSEHLSKRLSERSRAKCKI
jgi:hypothetical protein